MPGCRRRPASSWAGWREACSKGGRGDRTTIVQPAATTSPETPAGSARIAARLRTEYAGLRARTKRAALRALLTYVENQDDRLAYDRFRAAGFDLGSGRVEAACKHVVAIRMKRCGMRWSKAGSQNVLSLRTAWLNGQWNALWNTHPLAAA